MHRQRVQPLLPRELIALVLLMAVPDGLIVSTRAASSKEIEIVVVRHGQIFGTCPWRCLDARM